MASNKRIHQMTIGQWEKAFPTDDACKAYLTRHRWPLGVRCARCGMDGCYDLSNSRPFHWQCQKCAPGGYRFSVLAGTVFENTNLPLRMWFRIIHMMLTAKKGVSALQVHRTLGTGSYKTAWYACHRIRAGLANEDFNKLMGIVEVDETFVGGKAHNKHGDRRDGKPGGTASGKIAVVGAVQRKGRVVARVINSVSADVLTGFIQESVSHKVSLLCTDQWTGYRRLKSLEYPHKVIHHTAGEYVVGAVHTNTIEGFWSIFKRGVVGTFHKVSRKYLPLYVAEFQFRYNNRLNENIFAEAIKGC